MVVEPKMTQPVEPDKESIDLFNSTDRGVQKPSLFSKMLVQPVERRSRGGRGPTVICHALNANG